MWLQYQIIHTCCYCSDSRLLHNTLSCPPCHTSPSVYLLLGFLNHSSFIWCFSFTAAQKWSVFFLLFVHCLNPCFRYSTFSTTLVFFFLNGFHVALLTSLDRVLYCVKFYLHIPFSASSSPKCPSNSRCMRLPGGDSSFHDNSRLRG